ncbi:MAG: glycosyltransferase N-terminal domain-containing protein, partial [Bacteroidales bacterium]|nr:glycosyltransferase N-terminal domain-containing protein [Bacteroidales bacterium]
MRYIYSIFIALYTSSIFLVSPFNKKAKLIIKGRKKTFEKIREGISKKDKVAWFHCASLGEFEQGRPLIENF